MASEDSACEDESDNDSLYDFDVASSSPSDDGDSVSEDRFSAALDERVDSPRQQDTTEESSVNWTIADKLGGYSSRKEALRKLYITENARFKYKHKYSTRDGTVAVTITGEHNILVSQTPRTGIHKRFEVECDNLLVGGATPARCLVVLQERYRNQADLLKELPDTLQLRNRSDVRKDNGDFDIKTLADVNLWASPKMCNSKSQFSMRNESSSFEEFCVHDSAYKDELLVLHTFHEPLPDAKDEVSLGIVFTSRHLFRDLLLA
ncbi:hypothetical protein PF002_g811 [Phytophthora fragariae]|uniref:Uncharacterized protein n=1 Tax=Phytophthora fragariae TaxID=53985 RepID=A0A6A3EZQ7_9STRA|nr:hypothetical protein PF009_g14588 [Phytophthora fragariae]KAE9105512.1 hypothetical protein PF007_g13678 [Phytophthora fragariae]KAE9142413.1 hypothetical protein PF006_g12470 [Phytophthora fragariae]KAE9257642.1 hypothetical protein PF002_g811 [Phytophthora fragariae]KAE9304948.1 hypothetical protein PF001_g12822 [Phytophthora fragariae]